MTKSVANDPRIGVTHNRALCCECGTGRTYSKKAGLRNHWSRAATPEEIAEHRPLRPHLWEGVEPYHRQLADMKCATCRAITRHALIRDCAEPKHRNHEEIEDHARTALAPHHSHTEIVGEGLLAEEMRRVGGFGVRFEWRDCGADREPTTIEVEQALFDMSWTFTLNAAVPAQILYEALNDVWAWISDRERCEKLRWKRNKSARYAEFTYRDPWIARYVDAATEDLLPQALAWAQSNGDLA
jgi:hypothetical protein